MTIKGHVALGAGLLLLSACGGGDGGGGSDASAGEGGGAKAECINRFVAPGSSVVSGCTSCQQGIEAAKANDGQRASFAKLTPSGTSSDSGGIDVSATVGAMYLRVEAPSGVSFPAGQPVGAIARLAGGATPVVQSVVVSTLLGDVVQESFTVDPSEASDYADQDRRFAYPATKAYDAVQFTLQITQPVGLESAPTVKVYEFCG